MEGSPGSNRDMAKTHPAANRSGRRSACSRAVEAPMERPQRPAKKRNMLQYSYNVMLQCHVISWLFNKTSWHQLASVGISWPVFWRPLHPEHSTNACDPIGFSKVIHNHRQVVSLVVSKAQVPTHRLHRGSNRSTVDLHSSAHSPSERPEPAKSRQKTWASMAEQIHAVWRNLLANPAMF